MTGESGSEPGRTLSATPPIPRGKLLTHLRIQGGSGDDRPRISVFNLLNRQGETRVQDAFNPDGAFDASGNAVQHPNYGKILERQGPRLFRVAMKVSF